MAGCTHNCFFLSFSHFVSVLPLNLSLDSKVGKVLEYMAGLDSSSSSSSSRGNSSLKTKNTALTSNYFSRVRRLALNPIPNSAGSMQNFARYTQATSTPRSRTPRASHACGGSDYTLSWRPPLPLPSTLTLPRRHTTPTGYHSTLAPVSVSTPTNSLMPSYFPAYLARLRTSNPRVEQVGIILYLAEGQGLMPPPPPSPERELSGEGENEGGEDTDPLLPALDATLMSFPALRAVHVCVVPVARCSTQGWNAARRDTDAAEADAEAETERQEARRAELHVCNLEELHEWEQGSGTGGG
ncbi:hypothetical protein DFH08DRAFT_964172 [Mycena albidolilacea]|uniref:Uncharacterized protein n=1 Tax=Mycena albidolilacea TaxID=1033008 RepID=A0AAD7EMP1_9AGAR|nr:hypothetical protein DFH08DRAFT_964172 [Mycena albidolilacea]